MTHGLPTAPRNGRRSPWRLPVAVAAMLVLTSACSSTTDTADEETPNGEAVDLKPYTGPDEANFATVSAPEPAADGPEFVLGYLTAFKAIPGLAAEEAGACAMAEELGGRCIAKDANVSVQTQVSQFNELLGQGATAIAIQPLDPQALAPSLTSAAADGVPVVGADMPPDPNSDPTADLTSNVSQALDYSSWATMSAIAETMPGAHFAVLGTASPNPLLQYLLDRQQYWAEQQGLIFDGRVDAETDAPAAWSTAAGAIAQRYPDTDVVVSYNDASAVAALNTLRASGSDTKVANANGYSSVAQEAIKSGGMVASYAVPWDEKGRAQAIQAYNALTGADVPVTIALKGEVVTADNVDDIEPTG